MTTTTNQHTWIGKDIKRHEDPALLMGTAIYTNDVSLPGMLHAAVLRSPYAHARIVSIDTSAAKKYLERGTGDDAAFLQLSVRT